MNILFLTSNNLATNPRIYKELLLAAGRNHSVRLIQFKLGNWSDQKTDSLNSDLYRTNSEDDSGTSTFEVTSINATRRPFLSWTFWAVMEWSSRRFYTLVQKSLTISALAQSRRSIQLLLKAKSLSEKPDLIIAHNLSALYPGFRLSEQFKAPFIFDIEDYHPGEEIKKDAKGEKRRREFLMRNLLPRAAALTSASPLIKKHSEILTGTHPNHHVILNTFPKSEFVASGNLDEAPPGSGTLKFVWFSQKISFGRGIELFLEALRILHSSSPEISKSLNLTLIGAMDPTYQSRIIDPFKSNFPDLTTHPQMPQSELHRSLANFDIGLAIEPGKDLNNTLALSNKILAYTQSGLYILATDTPAQEQFIKEDKDRGILTRSNPEKMAEALIAIWKNRDDLRKNRERRYKKALSLAWDFESRKILDQWEEMSANKQSIYK